MTSGRLLNYLSQGLFADLPDPVLLAPDIAVGGLAVYWSEDTAELYVLQLSGPTWELVGGGGGGGGLTYKQIQSQILLGA